MRRYFTLVLCLFFITLVLTGCSSSTDKAKEDVDKGTEKAAAKVNEDAEKAEKENPDDVWIYYNDANWTDNFDGLVTEIVKVVVSDELPKVGTPDGSKHSGVGVKFKIENTTENKFVTYPDQAVLITSTGEQINNPDLWVSDHLGGEIGKGVIKEGNVIWYLERGHAEDIEWVSLEWTARKGADMDWNAEAKEYEVELKLK